MQSNLIAVWGGDRARPDLARAQVLLGSDPECLYVLGERADRVLLEVWNPTTGIREKTVVVSSAGQLRSARVWRADRDDQVVVAVRGVDRNELMVLDLGTGALWEEQPVPFGEHVMAASRDACTRVVFDRERPGDAEVVTREGSLRPQMLQGANTYAVSGDGALIASWNDATHRIFVFEAPPSLAVVASTDARYAFTAPHMVFSDDRSTLWCASQGAVHCFALPSMIELGRWTGASASAEIVAVDRTGRAALLDGPIAFSVRHDAPVRPRDFVWSPHLARLSPDGARLAHASGVLGWHDLARDRRVELHTGGHAGAVLAIAASPDGSAVATAANDRTIRVCDAVTGDIAWVLEGDAEGFGALAFAPDGRTLYAVTHGHAPRLTAWSLDDGAECTPAPLAFEGMGPIAVSDDGTRLVAAHVRAGAVVLVDLARFARVAADPRSADDRSVACFADGDRVRVVDAGRRARFALLDAATGELLVEGDAGGALALRAFDGFTRDGQRLVTFEEDRFDACVAVVRDAGDLRREAPSVATRLAGPVTASALGSARVAVAIAGQGACVVEAATQSRWYFARELRVAITALALSADEGTLYVGTENGQVRVYRVSNR